MIGVYDTIRELSVFIYFNYILYQRLKFLSFFFFGVTIPTCIVPVGHGNPQFLPRDFLHWNSDSDPPTSPRPSVHRPYYASLFYEARLPSRIRFRVSPPSRSTQPLCALSHTDLTSYGLLTPLICSDPSFLPPLWPLERFVGNF